VNRLWALLVALCAVGILLASPFLLGAIRAVQSPMAPPVLLTLQALQTLLLCALHFPSIALARIPLTGAVIAHVLLANGIAGVVFGWLFRRRGLEGAMVAHGSADLCLQAALPALLA
jgi:hypothetical protein